MMKLQHWKDRAGQGRFDMFSCLNGLVSDSSSYELHIKAIIMSHLELVHENFVHYFPAESIDLQQQYAWVRNPFTANTSELSAPTEEESQLIELICDQTLKTKFTEVSLSSFWLHAAAEYPEIASKAVSVLLPF